MSNCDRTITGVEFPSVAGVVPPARGAAITIPVDTGWCIPFDQLSDGDVVSWDYPFPGSMQWIDVGGPYDGLYFASHDDTPLGKSFAVGRSGDRVNLSTELTGLAVEPGETLELPPVVIGSHHEDWRAAAAIYREWIDSLAEKPEVPESILRTPCAVPSEIGSPESEIEAAAACPGAEPTLGLEAGIWTPDPSTRGDWAGYIGCLEDLRMRMEEIDPDYLMVHGGVLDLVGEYFDLLRSEVAWSFRGPHNGRPMPELFKYTLPWLQVCTGPLPQDRLDLLKLCHLAGSGWQPQGQLDPTFDAVRGWRETYWREMALGNYLGPCQTNSPDYRACAFEGEKRTLVALAWTPSDPGTEPPECVTVRVSTKVHPKTLRVLTPAGETGAESVPKYGLLEITVPFADIGLLVME